MNPVKVNVAENKSWAMQDLEAISTGNLYGEYRLAIVALNREQSGKTKPAYSMPARDWMTAPLPICFWKLLKDPQNQLQSARGHRQFPITGTMFLKLGH